MQTAERLEIPFIHHVNQKTNLEDISNLLVDSIKAKLAILNKINENKKI